MLTKEQSDDKTIKALKKEFWVSRNDTSDFCCDICLSNTNKDDDDIVFCDACNVGVHQTCYGVN